MLHFLKLMQLCLARVLNTINKNLNNPIYLEIDEDIILKIN